MKKASAVHLAKIDSIESTAGKNSIEALFAIGDEVNAIWDSEGCTKLKNAVDEIAKAQYKKPYGHPVSYYSQASRLVKRLTKTERRKLASLSIKAAHVAMYCTCSKKLRLKLVSELEAGANASSLFTIEKKKRNVSTGRKNHIEVDKAETTINGIMDVTIRVMFNYELQRGKIVDGICNLVTRFPEAERLGVLEAAQQRIQRGLKP